MAGPQTDRLQSGWAALSAARWDDARAAFAAALAAHESPAACEGLSWAAWWLDDAEAGSRRAGARYALQTPGRSPLPRVWRRGSRATSSTSTARGRWRGLAAPRPTPTRSARARARPRLAQLHEGYIAHANGETRRPSEPRSRRSSGGASAVVDLEMLGLALEGAVLVTFAQVARACRTRRGDGDGGGR